MQTFKLFINNGNCLVQTVKVAKSVQHLVATA